MHTKSTVKAHHLDDPDFSKFLKLCQTHQQIGSKLGCSKACSKQSVMCENCQSHSQQQKTHQNLQIQQFARIVKLIRKQYKRYHQIYIWETIPIFIQSIKKAVLSVIRELSQWDQSTVLLNKFLGVQLNQKITQLLIDNVEDWQMNNFTCNDMFQLQMLALNVQKQKEQDWRQRVFSDLGQMLKRALVGYGVVGGLGQDGVENIVVKGNVQQVTKKLQKLQQTLPPDNETRKMRAQSLTLSLTQDMKINEVQEQTTEKPKQQKNKEENQIQAQAQTQTQRQKQVQQLGKMAQILFNYICQASYQQVYLQFMLHKSYQYSEFWNFVAELLVSFVQNRKNNQLQSITYQCNNYQQISKLFSDCFANENIPYHKTQVSITQQQKGILRQQQLKPIETTLSHCILQLEGIKIILMPLS